MEKEVDEVNQFDENCPAPGDAEVFEAIHEIMHLFRARQYQSLRAAESELTHMENKALGYIARHPGATGRDLALRSGRDKAQVTRLVQGLREKGLVEARADDTDRRSARLFLTPVGQAVHTELHQHGLLLAAQALGGLDEAERRQLAALLARVGNRLRGER